MHCVSHCLNLAVVKSLQVANVQNTCKVALMVLISFAASIKSLSSDCKLKVNPFKYGRHELVITKSLRNSVVVIANKRVLASVSASDVLFC